MLLYYYDAREGICMTRWDSCYIHVYVGRKWWRAGSASYKVFEERKERINNSEGWRVDRERERERERKVDVSDCVEVVIASGEGAQ